MSALASCCTICLDITEIIIADSETNVNTKIADFLIYIPLTLVFSLILSFSLDFSKIVLIFLGDGTHDVPVDSEQIKNIPRVIPGDIFTYRRVIRN
jgi:hypothetical protein